MIEIFTNQIRNNYLSTWGSCFIWHSHSIISSTAKLKQRLATVFSPHTPPFCSLFYSSRYLLNLRKREFWSNVEINWRASSIEFHRKQMILHAPMENHRLKTEQQYDFKSVLQYLHVLEFTSSVRQSIREMWLNALSVLDTLLGRHQVP